MAIKFTPEQDAFIANNINKCCTVYDLTDLFNIAFPFHQITRDNLQYRMRKLGIRKGTHHIRKNKISCKNPVGTIITTSRKDGTQATRIKTKDGYFPANKYYVEKVFGKSFKTHVIVHLNGNKLDFSPSNIACIERKIYHGLCWRGWFFADPEITKTAILTQKLLNYFPDLKHNENQYYGIRGDSKND